MTKSTFVQKVETGEQKTADFTITTFARQPICNPGPNRRSLGGHPSRARKFKSRMEFNEELMLDQFGSCDLEPIQDNKAAPENCEQTAFLEGKKSRGISGLLGAS